jgi:hypothetical protein
MADPLKMPDVPQPTGADAVYAAAKTIAGLVPVGGDVFEWFIESPLQRRKDKFLGEIKAAIEELARRHANLESLRNNDAFVDLVLKAMTIAMRNSHAEKRRALKNAIVNAGLSQTPGDIEQQMFVAWVGDFTEFHIRLLAFLDAPREWLSKRGEPAPPSKYARGIDMLATAALPGLKHNMGLASQIFRDLVNRGLLRETYHTMPAKVSYDSQTSDLGKRFIAFIADPM